MSPQISILVVDDSADGREMLAEYLTFRGFQVTEAEHGAAAVKTAQRIKPDIVLMDLSMPGLDGWEATRLLKADAETKDSIVIAVSAHAFAGERQRAKAAGCDAFVTKPFDLATLADALSAVMAKGLAALDVAGVALIGTARRPAKRRVKP